MKNPIEQIKGLGAWYVAARAFGRRAGSDARESKRRARVAQMPSPSGAFIVARRASCSGLMTLRAVFSSERDRAAIVDFEWAYVSPFAARLLDHQPRELVGHRLLSVLNEERERVTLFDHYRNVIEGGDRDPLEHAHVAGGSTRVLRHNALRLGAGVLVTLSDLSASRRQDVSRAEWLRLDSALHDLTHCLQAGK